MATIFTKIINGDIPGRFVWNDDTCIAMMDIRPLHPGHLLVIPKVEVDQWTELDEETTAHVMAVAHKIGKVLKEEVPCERVGLLIAGFEVPHVHVHVVPMQTMAQLDFRNAEVSPRADALDEMADGIRGALKAAGHGDNVPEAGPL